jgi:hypothetical protein
MAQQSGTTMDFNEYLRIASRLNGEPDWLRLFNQQGQPLDADTGKPAERPHKQPLGKYERVTRTAGGETSMDEEAMRTMQGAERAA